MFATIMLICRHWAIMAYSEELSDIIFGGKCEVHYIKKPTAFAVKHKSN